MNFVITQRFISMNRSSKQLNAIGTVVHETADAGASDENEFDYFNTANRGASAHAFVDYDSITQTIPWNEQAWHAGPTANATRIGIELCHYNDAARFVEVWNRAIWLFAWVHINIIKQTTITKDNLMSHAEVSAKWRESTHKDPVSYFAQFGKSVEDFRSEVQDKIKEMLGLNQTKDPKTQNPGVKSISTDNANLQRVLNRLMITDDKGSALVVDGILGSSTIEAIKKLQGLCGISVDGIVGKQTWSVINSILSKPFIKIGSKGIAVNYIQFRLGVSLDGIYGKETSSVVAKYQRSHHILADGNVGMATWLKLIG